MTSWSEASLKLGFHTSPGCPQYRYRWADSGAECPKVASGHHNTPWTPSIFPLKFNPILQFPPQYVIVLFPHPWVLLLP